MNTQDLLKQAEQSVEGIEQLAESLQVSDDGVALRVSSSIRAGLGRYLPRQDVGYFTPENGYYLETVDG